MRCVNNFPLFSTKSKTKSLCQVPEHFYADVLFSSSEKTMRRLPKCNFNEQICRVTRFEKVVIAEKTPIIDVHYPMTSL